MPTDTMVLADMNIELYSAGHVAGAAMTSIHANGKSLLYTGNFACMTLKSLLVATPNYFPSSPMYLFQSLHTVEQ